MPTVRHMKAKLALMGEGGVGKTSLIRRFVLNEYQDTYLHTVGTRVSKVELTVPHGVDTEVQMDMSIFDIMGQRGFGPRPGDVLPWLAGSDGCVRSHSEG